VLPVLDDFGTPYVEIGPDGKVLPNRPSMDDEAAAAAMTDHLIQLGHTDIAFVKGRAGTSTTRQRLEEYRRALARSGLCRQNDLVVSGDYTLRSGFYAGEKLLRPNSTPPAVFASNDEMAAGVVTAAMKRNSVVPDDISVAGFDNSPTATMIWP
jgi:LacI family transcriptional regulator